MHHDPLLNSAHKPLCSVGHGWVVLAMWVPLPVGAGRVFALPVLFRLYVSAKRGGERRTVLARRPTCTCSAACGGVRRCMRRLGPPSQPARLDMLRRFTAGVPQMRADLRWVAGEMAGLTGAELRELVVTAFAEAQREARASGQAHDGASAPAPLEAMHFVRALRQLAAAQSAAQRSGVRKRARGAGTSSASHTQPVHSPSRPFEPNEPGCPRALRDVSARVSQWAPD